MLDLDIFEVLEEGAKEDKKKSIHELALMVQQFFDDEIMENTPAAMMEKPLPEEFDKYCYNIVLAFMFDLILAGRAEGWFWVQGGNPKKMNEQGRSWVHSWLEYNGFAVDATVRQKQKPDKPTVHIAEIEFYYKARDITNIIKRRNARQTEMWIFQHTKDEV